MAAICIAGAGDLPAILDLWQRAGTEPGHTDDIESLTKLIAHDPGALLVAVEDETIAGSVIAAWDGWRGSIYRLAVAPSPAPRAWHCVGERRREAPPDVGSGPSAGHCRGD